MKIIHKLMIAVLYVGTITFANHASALTLYATDQVRVPVRGGSGLNHKIIKMIPAGIPVRVLRKDQRTGYVLVQWAPKSRGWIAGKLLMTDKPAALRLNNAGKQIASLKKKILTMEQENQTASTIHKVAKRESERVELLASELKVQNATLAKLVGSTANMAKQNKALLSKLEKTYQELKIAREQTGSFKASDSRKWFIWGSILTALAFFTGIGVTRIRWRRDNLWS